MMILPPWIRLLVCKRGFLHAANRLSGVVLFFLCGIELAGCGHSSTSNTAIDMQRIRALRDRTYRGVTAMRALEGSGFSESGCPKRAYELADLNRIAEAGLTDLINLIPVQAEPLRAFVRVSYPKPRPNGVEIPYKCFERRDLVSSFFVYNFLHEAESLLDQFSREPSIIIDLDIKSSPAGGSYILKSIHTDVGKVENVTNSTAKIYRGVYDFAVTKAGLKPGRLGSINFVNSTPRVIECQLKDNGDTDDSTCQYR